MTSANEWTQAVGTGENNAPSIKREKKLLGKAFLPYRLAHHQREINEFQIPYIFYLFFLINYLFKKIFILHTTFITYITLLLTIQYLLVTTETLQINFRRLLRH